MRRASRSPKRITSRDLARLAAIARSDRREFYSRRARPAGLKGAVLCAGLCQGAALHYVDGKNGVKDFDVWTFYARARSAKFPPRRIVSRDFGDPKFGRSSDRPDFVGRRVDLLGRSLDVPRGADPVSALRHYLTDGKTDSARLLAQKAVVLVEPAALRGTVVWPVQLPEQLSVLADCGIRLKRGVSIRDVRATDFGGGYQAGESMSYAQVLEALGFETSRPPHRELSDDIWYLDVECIYKPGDYAAIARRLRALAGAALPLRRVRDHIDFDRDEAWIEFTLDRRRVHWDLRLKRDWVDGNLFARFAKLLAGRRAGKKFTFHSLGGQDCLIGCATPDQVRRLKRDAGVHFEWLRAGLI